MKPLSLICSSAKATPPQPLANGQSRKLFFFPLFLCRHPSSLSLDCSLSGTWDITRHSSRQPFEATTRISATTWALKITSSTPRTLGLICIWSRHPSAAPIAAKCCGMRGWVQVDIRPCFHFIVMFATSTADHQGSYSTNIFGARAVDVIENHDASTPLFMYLAWQGVHAPRQAPVSYW